MMAEDDPPAEPPTIRPRPPGEPEPYWYLNFGDGCAITALLSGMLQEIVAWRPPQERRAANLRLEGRIISICERMLGDLIEVGHTDHDYDGAAWAASKQVNEVLREALGRWHTPWTPERRSKDWPRDR